MYSIRFETMPPQISGLIDHNEGIIKLNSLKSKTRQTVSLIHELIHLYSYISKKKPMSERDVHDLSVFIYSEVLPRVSDLQRVHNSFDDNKGTTKVHNSFVNKIATKRSDTMPAISSSYDMILDY